MAYEVFTTYTEVDPNNRITVESSKVTGTGLANNESAYVYSDKGVNHFNGNFEHLLTVRADSANDGSDLTRWSVCNDVNDVNSIHTANGSLLRFAYYISTGQVFLLVLQEMDSGTYYTNTWTGAVATTYYLKIKRDESVGTYGTLYCYVYSDAARTTLLKTLTVALHTSKKDFRYIYAIQTFNQALAPTQTGYTENLDLQEAAGTNFQLNIGDTYKAVSAIQVNVGDSWKAITKGQVNLGDTWKSIF